MIKKKPFYKRLDQYHIFNKMKRKRAKVVKIFYMVLRKKKFYFLKKNLFLVF